MAKNIIKLLEGYQAFRNKYASGDTSVMQHLSFHGQKPKIMVVACCDSRVDPALILQCEPGDLFVTRNVANIVPPYEKDGFHHGTSAALEFGVRFLNVEHLILLGHSQCGGILSLLSHENDNPNDFITPWVSVIQEKNFTLEEADECAKLAVQQSYKNCLTFPWIQEKVNKDELAIHQWFFDIKTGQIFTYSEDDPFYHPL